MDKSIIPLIVMMTIMITFSGFWFGADYQKKYDAEHNNLCCPVCGSNSLSISFNYDNPKGTQMQIWCQKCGTYTKIELWNHLNDSEYLDWSLTI